VATNFPTSLDALTNPTGASSLTSPDHAGQHADANDAIEALQAKVGVNSSAVTSSLDYKVGLIAGRNRIINGGMSVWQRGTSFADPANMTGYTADRWASVWGTTGRTFSQQAGFANSRYCLRVQRNSGSTGTGLSGIAYIFETANSIMFQGKTVTLSFNARCGANFSATSSILGVTTYSGTGTDQSGSTFYTPGWTGQTAVINTSATLTTTSQRFTFTGTVASNATQLVIYLNFVPTGTAGAADHFEITNVQLEEGAVATPFEFEDYQVTLAKCQRYYFRVGGDSSYQRFGYGTFTGATSARVEIYNPVTMRSIPSSIESSTIALYDQSAVFSVTAFTLSTAGSGKNLTQFDATVASGGTTYRPVDIVANASTSAYIGVNAEL